MRQTTRKPRFRIPAALCLALLIGGMLAPGALAQEGEAEAKAEEKPVPVKRVKMYVESWEFIPKEIRVRQGTKLVLEFESRDADHSFKMKKGYKINVPLPENSKKTFEFVASRAGKFTFFCGRPCGNGCAKMNGKLIVIPADEAGDEGP